MGHLCSLFHWLAPRMNHRISTFTPCFRRPQTSPSTIPTSLAAPVLWMSRCWYKDVVFPVCLTNVTENHPYGCKREHLQSSALLSERGMKTWLQDQQRCPDTHCALVWCLDALDAPLSAPSSRLLGNQASCVPARWSESVATALHLLSTFLVD